MKFKVCGLFNNENIQHVAELNPDYIGPIFWEKSVRYVLRKSLSISTISRYVEGFLR